MVIENCQVAGEQISEGYGGVIGFLYLYGCNCNLCKSVFLYMYAKASIQHRDCQGSDQLQCMETTAR